MKAKIRHTAKKHDTPSSTRLSDKKEMSVIVKINNYTTISIKKKTTLTIEVKGKQKRLGHHLFFSFKARSETFAMLSILLKR